MKRIRIILTGITALLLTGIFVQAQTDTAWTPQKAAAWYKKGTWKKGLRLKPYKDMNQLEFARQYQAHPGWWDKAIAFMDPKNLDTLKPGHYAIEGEDVFADITDNPSTPLPEAKWHSHRKYCDIQYVIKGVERVGMAPVAGAPIVTPFNDQKGDSQFYNQDLKGTYYTADTDTFFFFFPTDAHRPFIKVDGTGPVTRVRFKVRTRMVAN